MTAAVTDPFSVTWGSFSVGGTSDYKIVGPVRLEKGFVSGSMSFQVLVTAATDALFAAGCAEIESEFSKRRQNVVFKVGTENIESWSHSSNTGLNTVATCRKAGTRGADSDRSRLYDVTIACEFPASDASGQRDFTLGLQYLPSRAIVATITGTYTATGGSSASAAYSAAIATYWASVKPSGTFEIVNETTAQDRENKVITFSRTYVELLENQSSAGLDHASIVSHSLRLRRTTNRPGDAYPGTKRLDGIIAEWSCDVDHDQTTDLATLYTGTIRPFILARALARYGASQIAVLDESRDLDYTANRITANWQMLAVIEGASVIQSTETTGHTFDGSTVVTPAWDGGVHSKWRDKGHATLRKTKTYSLTYMGSRTPRQKPDGDEWQGRWHLPPGGFVETATPVIYGQDALGNLITVTVINGSETWEYTEEPGGTGGNTTPGDAPPVEGQPPRQDTTPGVSPSAAPTPPPKFTVSVGETIGPPPFSMGGAAPTPPR